MKDIKLSIYIQNHQQEQTFSFFIYEPFNEGEEEEKNCVI